MAEFNIELTLATKTCKLGHVYAVPHWIVDSYYQCPMCAQQRFEELRLRKADSDDEIQKLQRTNAALRGVIKRKR